MRRWIVAFATIAGTLAAAPAARANDPATAQMLFDQARKLMTENRFAEACPKLEESQRLDPAGGTLLHLALCREREGRIATAWAHYQDALSQAKRDGRKDRAKIAQERIDVLGPRLPRMRVRIAPANRGLPHFRLTRGELAVGAAQWSESVPVDPGSHVMRAEADGRKPWTMKVDVPADPKEVTVDVPELAIDVHAGEVAAPPKKDEPPRVRYDDASGDSGNTQRTLAFVAGGVGIAGVAVGTIFGVLALNKKKEADGSCRPPDYTVCSQKGLDADSASKTSGTVSTVAFIAGGALLAGGAVLYFTAPDSSTTVAVAPNGVSVLGRF